VNVMLAILIGPLFPGVISSFRPSG
jgi:hypothetical protein